MSNYDDASLIMFPSGYKEDKIYSLKPTDGSGDLTFTRASTATRVNAEGLIEQVPYNLLQYSEEFDNAVWTKVGCSIITDSIISPNELFYSDYLKENISTSEHRLRFAGIPKSSNQVMTFSAYVKPNGRHLQMSLEYSGVGVQSIFNITNNTYTLSDSASWTRLSTEILNIGDGWYRCSISAITDANVSINARLQLASNPIGGVNQIYTGDGTSGIYIWGAQLVTGTTAKTYFPTTDRLDVPRIDYTGGGCGKLLLEPQRTNVVTYSEQFDNAAWTKLNLTVSANSVTSPDGTQNADTITDNTTNGAHYTYQFGTQTTGTAWTCYMKKGSLDYGFIGAVQTSEFRTTAIINLTNGAIVELQNGSSTTGTVTAEDCGNGWYRVKMQTNANGAGYSVGTSNGAALSGGNKEPIYTGTGSGTIYLWGAQLEDSTYATSYIPTLASSVTRLADAASKTGISSLIGQTEGTILWDVQIDTAVATGNEAILNIDAGAGFGNTIYLIKGTTGNITGEMYLVGVLQASFTLSGISAGNYKIAFAYAGNNTAMFVNGVQVGTTDTSCAVPAMSRIELGNGVFGPSTDKTAQVLLFPTRLSDATLETLTTL